MHTSSRQRQTTLRRIYTAALTLSLSCSATGLHAGLIEFNDFRHYGSDHVDYRVIIADDAETGVSSGYFKISFGTTSSSSNEVGKLTGFFFDVADPAIPNNSPYDINTLGLQNETHASCSQAFNTHSINPPPTACNTNLNLGADAGALRKHEFDVALAWKSGIDLTGGQVGSFEIAMLDGMTLNDWRNIGLRGQEVGTNGGSAKELALTAAIMPRQAPNIPIPSSLLLLAPLLAWMILRMRSTIALDRLP